MTDQTLEYTYTKRGKHFARCKACRPDVVAREFDARILTTRFNTSTSDPETSCSPSYSEGRAALPAPPWPDPLDPASLASSHLVSK